MGILYILIFVLFIIFIASLLIGIIKIFWPVLLVLAIYLGYRYHKAVKEIEKNNESITQYNTLQNGDVFEADYEVKDEEE